MSKPSGMDQTGCHQGPCSESLLRALVRTLSTVAEPRKARGIRHPLVNVLTIAVLGCMCRCDDAEALEDWGQKEADWLSDFLDMPHGVPSQDVFLRLLAALDPKCFRMAFHTWMKEVFSLLGVDSLAIDGQTHRRSGDARSGTKPLHMVHGLLCEAGLVLGQVATEKKSNEAKAIPALLDLLDLRGALVSIDAMGTQVNNARKIVDGGGDYLLGLKGNQSSLPCQVQQAFAEALDNRPRAVDELPPPNLTQETQVDGGHGRVETRTARVLEGFGPWVPSGQRWKGLSSLVAITATREDTVTGKICEETRYYISSRVLTPAEANKRVRAHWLVENRLHWCLDMSFGQDACRIRNYKGDRYSVPRRRRLCDFLLEYRERVLQSVASV